MKIVCQVVEEDLQAAAVFAPSSAMHQVSRYRACRFLPFWMLAGVVLSSIAFGAGTSHKREWKSSDRPAHRAPVDSAQARH